MLMPDNVSGIKKFWHRLGPGLITGAADDDPSGIVTYAVAGAKFGLSVLWMSIATLPFMIIVQRMAGRIGLVSGRGLAGNMKKYYPRWLLVLMAVLILIANIINIGADISGMSASFEILLPNFSPILFSAAISAIIIVFLILLPYRTIAKYLKWVAIIMFSYVFAAIMEEQNWLQILYRSFVPQIMLTKDYLLIAAAFFGTTISPYLFFWQASEAVEEETLHKSSKPNESHMIPGIEPHGQHRSKEIIKNEIGSMYQDVRYGMVFSNLITFFIIILSTATFFKNGINVIGNVSQIASSLKPLAGNYANLLFLLGVLASGTLAIPILAGSAAYALAELFGWRYGFNNKFHKAKQFYIVIIISTLLGILIPALKLHTVDILVYTAIIYGFISPPLILLLIHMANNEKIMGKYTSRPLSNIIAYSLFILMTASIALIFIL